MIKIRSTTLDYFSAIASIALVPAVSDTALASGPKWPGRSRQGLEIVVPRHELGVRRSTRSVSGTLSNR